MIDSDNVTSHFQPLIECEDRWYTFCFGGNLETLDSELVSDEGTMPLMSILLSMSQVAILQLLDYHMDCFQVAILQLLDYHVDCFQVAILQLLDYHVDCFWVAILQLLDYHVDCFQVAIVQLLDYHVDCFQVAILQLLDYHVDWLEQKSTFTYHQGRWLYALLTCVELPLIPETCSTVRTLARECSRIRATLDPTDENTLDQLNFFICLVTKYFRQYDLGEVL
uniref:Uncharacterized protein n=1 Tax=Timema cristinae TaxID=61476 RepID=A0A7R9DFI7_TIMCR|nr:unnamed protein product [Timema cristinae]